MPGWRTCRRGVEAALTSLATLLSRALDGYRQRALRRLIELAHADVDTSLLLLQRLAALYVDEIDSERGQAALYWYCQLSPNGEVLDKYWGRREFKRVADGYAVDLTTLQTYTQALAQVRRDHAALRETLALGGNALKQALTALSATDGARTVLKRIAAISQVITLVGDVVVLAQVVALQKWGLVAPALAGV